MTDHQAPTVHEVGAYFSQIYATLAASPTHTRIGRTALGDGYVGQMGFAGLTEIRRVAELVGAVPGKQILDLCCGTAGVAALVARKTGAAVVGVDCASHALRLAHPHRHLLSGLVVADADRLPFANASFDGVISVDGFSYTFRSMAQEAARVLRPGAILAMLVSVDMPTVRDFEGTLANAGFQEIRFVNVTAEGAALMRSWLAEYRREQQDHIREVGERYHLALVSEIEDLLAAFAHRRKMRAYVTAVRP